MADIPTSAEAPAFELGATLCARFATASARAARIEADLATRIAPLKAAADARLAPILADLDETRGELEAWWAVHSTELTKGKKKSAELAGVVLGTRKAAAQLLFAHGDDKAAVKVLLAARLTRLVRRVLSPDKKAIAERVTAEPDGDVAALGFAMSEAADVFFAEPAVRAGRKA